MNIASHPHRWIKLSLALALFALATWLRWRYALHGAAHVDEYTTVWAGQQTAKHGIPLLPSGVIYPRGLLISYLLAAAGSFTAVTLTTGRLINLCFGVGAVGLTLLVGWRGWRFAVGLLAASGLALATESVQWSSSARFYAPMQFFALLTVWMAYRLAAWRDDSQLTMRSTALWGRTLGFAAAFALGIASQEIIVLFLPPLCLLLLWWQGWRFFLRPAVITAFLLCLLVLAARLLLDLVGQPGQLATFQSNRPYVSLLIDLPGAWAVYGPLLIQPERLPWTLGVALAVLGCVIALWHTRGAVTRMPALVQITLFFALATLFVLGILLSVAGAEWHEVRFFLALQPMWLLCASAGLWELITWFVPGSRWPNLAWGVLTVGLLLAGWGAVQNLLRQQGNSIDAALAYVAAQRQPGAVVLSTQPAACALVIGNCNYYAREQGFEPYVIARGDQLVDRYTGLPLLRTTAQLEALLKTAPAVWFVIDRETLASNSYDQDFLRVVVEQFTLPFTERRGLALRAQGWQPQPPMAREVTLNPPLVYGPLQLTGWAHSAPIPGQPLALTLFWRTAERNSDQFVSSARVMAPGNAVVAQIDEPLARGLLPLQSNYDLPLPDPKVLRLPTDLSPGRYRIDLLAYPATTQTPLVEQPLTIAWFWYGAPPAPPQVSLNRDWANGIRLIGHNGIPTTLAPGAALHVETQWTALQTIHEAYTFFAHLIGPDGQLIAQDDHQPEAGFYPTWGWIPQAPVADAFQLTLPPNLAPGDYQLVVGWYLPSNGERVKLTDGSDTLSLAVWTIKAK